VPQVPEVQRHGGLMRLLNILFDTGAGRFAQPQIGGPKIRAFAGD
jgi:hypothetical protein